MDCTYSFLNAVVFKMYINKNTQELSQVYVRYIKFGVNTKHSTNSEFYLLHCIFLPSSRRKCLEKTKTNARSNYKAHGKDVDYWP